MLYKTQPSAVRRRMLERVKDKGRRCVLQELKVLLDYPLNDEREVARASLSLRTSEALLSRKRTKTPYNIQVTGRSVGTNLQSVS